MCEDESGAEIGRRLLTEAQRTAPAEPDFIKVYMLSGNRDSGKLAAMVRANRARSGAVTKRIPRFLPYAAAACLALGSGFLLGRFVLPHGLSSLYAVQTVQAYMPETGIQNEVRLYLSDLWGASADTVVWLP